jgi:hypothetical protein
MDVFKLAFETVIIGLFALPCLLVMIDVANPDLFTSSNISRLIAPIPAELRPQAIALTLFPLAYLLGSMIMPVSSEFLNDKDMLGGVLPNEEKIQTWTYSQIGAPPIPGLDITAKVQPANFSGETRSDLAYGTETFRKAVHKEFSREESTLLLRGLGSSGRIDRLHERLTVLQGATFSAFALMVLCGFAWFGRSSNGSNGASGALSRWQQVRRCTGFVLSLGFILVAARELINDLHSLEAGDMPVAELVFLVLGGFGVYAAIHGTRSRLDYHGVTFAFAFCFTLLCYAGYASTGTSYDQEIFNTYQGLTPATAVGSSHNVAQSALTSTFAQ